MSKTNKEYFLYAYSWTEYERGWGCRPDGVTVFLTEEAALAHRKNYYDKYNNADTVPDYYSMTDQVKPVVVSVSKDLYYAVQYGRVWTGTNTFESLKNWMGIAITPKTK